MNNVMSLEAVQTELIREILNVSDVLVLEKIKKCFIGKKGKRSKVLCV